MPTYPLKGEGGWGGIGIWPAPNQHSFFLIPPTHSRRTAIHAGIKRVLGFGGGSASSLAVWSSRLEQASGRDTAHYKIALLVGWVGGELGGGLWVELEAAVRHMST